MSVFSAGRRLLAKVSGKELELFILDILALDFPTSNLKSSKACYSELRKREGYGYLGCVAEM